MSGGLEKLTPFSVLVVCTANQCRSPMAEHMLRRALRRAGIGWTVSSAGTQAQPGQPMSGAAAVLLTKAGVDVTGWRSRVLDPDLIDGADLILTAEATQRSRVVTLRPNALARAFTLLQFARLCGHLEPVPDASGPAAGDLLLEAVLAARSHVQPGLPGADDIADPIGRRLKAYRAVGDVIEHAVDDIMGPLRATAGHGPVSG